MKIRLAGYNVPLKVLEKLDKTGVMGATPEVISAAYARISRSTDNVDELLDKAIKDVSRSRKSNRAIIYGMGHHSVADHVIFIWLGEVIETGPAKAFFENPKDERSRAYLAGDIG